MLEFFTTVSSKAVCQRIANVLVAEKLVACVSFWRVSSVYRWNGKVSKADEWMLCVKTSEKLGGQVEKRIKALHSYELPVVVVTRVKVARDVEKWVKQCTKK